MRSGLVKAFRSVDPLVEGGDDVDLPFLVRHDPAQYRVTSRPRASAHTFQKAMALHNIVFTVVNIRLLASSLERAIKVVKVPPKRRLKGPLEPERLRCTRQLSRWVYTPRNVSCLCYRYRPDEGHTFFTTVPMTVL